MRLTVLLAALLAAPVALAWHDEPWDCRVEGIVEVTGGSWGTTFYLDTREDALRDGVSLYEEANGYWHAKPAGVYRDADTEADLQRGGASPYIPDDAEIEVCEDEVLLVPDLFLF